MEITKLRHKKTGFWGFVVAVASFSIMFLFENNLVTTNPDAILNEILIRDLTRYIIVILPLFCYIINIQNYQEPICSWIIVGSTTPLMLWWGLLNVFYAFLTLIGYANSGESYQHIWYLFPPIFTIIAYVSDYEKVKLKLKGLGRKSYSATLYLVCAASVAVMAIGVQCYESMMQTNDIDECMLYVSSFAIPLVVFNVSLLLLMRNRYSRRYTEYAGTVILFSGIFLVIALMQFVIFIISGREYALQLRSRYHYEAGVVLWENRYLLAAWVVEALAFIFSLIPWAIKKK